VLVVGALVRPSSFEGFYLEAVLSTSVKKDGLDATVKIIAMIKSSRFSRQVNYIITQGTVLAGLNPINIKKISEALSVPVLSVVRDRPNKKRFLTAVRKLPNAERIIKELEANGEIYKYERCIRAVNYHRCKTLYYYLAGMGRKEAEELIRFSTYMGNIPEPVRIAHVIASGVSRGESTKRV